MKTFFFLKSAELCAKIIRMSGIRRETASDDGASQGSKRGDAMRIGIIGAGKVGVTLGKYLVDAGVTVCGFYSRTKTSAAQAADFVKTTLYEDLMDLVKASDTLFITVPDGEIGNVWDCIAGYDLTDKVVCHFSGSLSSNVFSGIERTGARGVSIHPMYAFSDKFTSYQEFHTACLVAEGDKQAILRMQKLFAEKLGHSMLFIRAEDKIKYHAAAALASNYMIALFETAIRLLGECGFSERDSLSVLRPIVRNNVTAMLEKGPVDALTGPVERGDLSTVEKHLDVLQGGAAEAVYRDLGDVLIDLAKQKHPDWDEQAMRACMKKKGKHEFVGI